MKMALLAATLLTMGALGFFGCLILLEPVLWARAKERLRKQYERQLRAVETRLALAEFSETARRSYERPVLDGETGEEV